MLILPIITLPFSQNDHKGSCQSSNTWCNTHQGIHRVVTLLLLLPYALLSFIYKQFPLALYHPIIQYKVFFCNTFQPAFLFIILNTVSVHSCKISVPYFKLWGDWNHSNKIVAKNYVNKQPCFLEKPSNYYFPVQNYWKKATLLNEIPQSLKFSSGRHSP